MKFNKKVLTEELGVSKSDKKTFTKDTKQKIVMTEEQLNRLLGVITEDSSWEESLHYGKDMGQDDKELYDLKHDDGGHVHIKDLEDDIHYDHDHDDGVEGELGEGKACPDVGFGVCKRCNTMIGQWEDIPGCGNSTGRSKTDDKFNPYDGPQRRTAGPGPKDLSDGGRPKGQMGESRRKGKLDERQLTNIVRKVILEHDTAPNGNPYPPHRHSAPKTSCRHLTCCDKKGNPVCPAGTPKSCPDNNNGYTFPVVLGSNGKCERGTSSRGGCCCNCNTGTSSPKSGGGCPELSHIKPWDGPCDGKGCEKACQGFAPTLYSESKREINEILPIVYAAGLLGFTALACLMGAAQQGGYGPCICESAGGTGQGDDGCSDSVIPPGTTTTDISQSAAMKLISACNESSKCRALNKRDIAAGNIAIAPKGYKGGDDTKGGRVSTGGPEPTDRRDVELGTNESRTLKTTQTINESDIDKMRIMFNRMNSTGKNYNPSRS